jgi:hypothetical protein
MHYKTIIPKNNADFIKHAGIVNPKGINEGEDPHFGVGWYFVWTKKYDASHGVAAEKALQEIIDTYFPKGRPEK